MKGLVVCLLVLCASARFALGRLKSPLIDEDGTRMINKAAECMFGSQVRELGSSWVPDLGIPIGVLYCMKCECVPLQRKRRIVARVQCRSIKNECPEPKCEEPVLLPGNCCKSCPGDNYSEEVQDIVPQNVMEEEERNSKYFAALLTGRSSLVMKNDNLEPVTYDNKNNVVATGRFTFQRKNLYFSFYISDKAARPRFLQFVDHDANILEEIILSGTGGIVNSHYQNATRKVCGVWKRLPRDYRRLLKEERLYVVLGWGVNDQAEFMLSGKITKYVALGTELFSSLLEPAPGSDPARLSGSGGTAIVSTSTTVSPSIHIAIVFNGLFTAQETNDISVNIALTLDERRQIILEEKVRILKPMHELNLVEISSPVTPADLRLLTRGRLVLSISSVSHPTALKLSGNVMTKATCELFQTTLSSPGVNRMGTSGLAWLYLNNEGSLVYNIQVDGLHNQQTPIAVTLMDIGAKRRTELEDLTPYYREGWANGTVDKIGPKLLEPLYAENLFVNIATHNESSLVRGRLTPRLVADARDAPAPILLKREAEFLPTSAVGMAWMNVNSDCNIHYDVTLTGLGNHSKQLEMYLEMLPMIAPDAPVVTRNLGILTANQVEGSSNDILKTEERNRLEFGACFLKVKDKHSKKTLLVAKLSQMKIPPNCRSHFLDNDVHTAYDSDQPPNRSCFNEGRFYKEEASWTSTKDPCTMCYCQNGNSKCDTTPCPELNCTTKIRKPGECCPICLNSRTQDVPGCTFGGKIYSSGSIFHPFLIPNGFDLCTECDCEGTEVKCTRKENQRNCCRNCKNEGLLKSENGTIQSDGEPAIITVPEIVFKPIKNKQQILEDGGCENQNRPSEPYENGQSFHPIISALGEYKCVTCICNDGKKSCKRYECTRSRCKRLLHAIRTNTLNASSQEACCSPQQCKKRHHRNHNNNRS